MNLKNTLNIIQLNFFNLFIYLTYTLLLLSYIGLFKYSQIYLNYVDYYVKIYICLFLIWRFNPLRSHYEFTDLDRKIAFSAGLFILTTTVLYSYVYDIHNFFQKYIKT